MEFREVGRTGLRVSRMSLGTNNFGRDVDEATSVRVIRKAIDLGINSVDTANLYTGRRSEEIIGKAMHGDRERFVIATKVGSEVGEGPDGSGLSPKHILSQITESLRLLQTDHLDIYYMHRFDPETPLGETLKTFDQLIHEGKVRHLACSNFTVENMRAMNEVSGRMGLEKISALQPPYNLLNREAERELFPFCRDNDLGVITYSPLAGGFLTGKYEDGVPAPTGTTIGVRAEIVSKSSIESSMPTSAAIASRCSTPLVDPPVAAMAAIAFSKASRVRTVEGRTSSVTSFIASAPAATAACGLPG